MPPHQLNLHHWRLKKSWEAKGDVNHSIFYFAEIVHGLESLIKVSLGFQKEYSCKGEEVEVVTRGASGMKEMKT